MKNEMIVIDGESLTIEEIVSIKEFSTKVRLSDESMNSINESRKLVEKIVSSGEVVYGINTGFGALSNVTVPSEQLEQLQSNLIRSHACGVGEKMDPDSVLMMMLVRVNSLAKGNSGARLELVQLLIDMINSRISPIIPRIGSLGASGDLAPLSHMTLAMMGESDVQVQNQDGTWTTGKSLDILNKALLILQHKGGVSHIF
mgnify:FL=1